MQNLIKIGKTYLTFRDDIRKIKRQASRKKNDGSLILLDFSKVNFISRNFADELCKMIEKSKRKNIIKITNLKPELRQFIDLVKVKRGKIKKGLMFAQ